MLEKLVKKVSSYFESDETDSGKEPHDSLPPPRPISNSRCVILNETITCWMYAEFLSLPLSERTFHAILREYNCSEQINQVQQR